MSKMAYDSDTMRREMLKRGWRYDDLRRETGLSRNTISKAIRTGCGHPSTFVKIASAFKVDLASLVPPPASIPANGPATPHAALSEASEPKGTTNGHHTTPRRRKTDNAESATPTLASSPQSSQLESSANV